VALASMMLQRTRRSQADAVLQDMLQRWPHPGALAAAEGLEEVLRPCGLHLSRARRVRRFCAQWLGDFWDDMRDLCGVGVYVADCVGYFCFGCKDLESTDWVLHQAVRG
jgi:endonuclease III